MREIIIHNFAPIACVILLITILFEGEQLVQMKRRSFLWTIGCFLVELFARNAEYITAESETYTEWRAVWSALLYISRAAILYAIIGTEINMKQKMSRTAFAVASIPLIMMTVVAVSVFFTDKVYWFDETNHFRTGDWGVLRYVPLLLYFVIAVIMIVRGTFKRNRAITVLGYECVALILMAMYFEYDSYPEFLCETAMIIGITFYYMYYQTNALLQENSTLLNVAHKDALTGVYNRAGYDSIVEGHPEWTDVGFLIMDIDKFKLINDNYGHDIGDQMLRRVASILQTTFREEDYIIRFGGDEFVVLIPGLGPEVAEIVQRKIESINVLLENLIGALPKSSVSAGVAFSSEGVTKELYTKADKALYEIKSTTRRGCRVFKEDSEVSNQV